ADARRVASVLTRLGGVAPDRVTVLVDRTPAEVLEALRRASEAAARFSAEDVVLFFYFSGHGDADDLHMAGERLPLATLARTLDAVPAGVRLEILDACRSRPRAKGLHRVEPFALSVDDLGTRPRARIRVQASSDGEDAQESDALGGGVFTHYLVSGLRGAADRDGDGQITFDEAYSWAFARTLRHSASGAGGLQHAEREVELSGAGTLVLTRPRTSDAALVLPADHDVQYLVYQLPGGAVFAEAWASAERRLTLALPAGRFLVQRRGTARYGAAEVAIPWGGRAELDADDFEAIPLARLVARGGRVLADRHELGVGYAALGNPERAVGHRLQLRYGYRFDDLAVTIGLGAGLEPWDTGANEVLSRWVGGDARVEGRLLLEPLELRLAGGVGWRWLHERLTRKDADRYAAAGLATESSSAAIGLGPAAAVELRVPLAGAWWLVAGVEGTFLLFDEAGDPRLRWDAGASLAGQVTF
ncbi:MAG: caspase family protein, partial [Deltaproteobacteria bacterium]